MKKTVFLTAICSVLATLIVVGALQWGIWEWNEIQAEKQSWQDRFQSEDPLTCKGRIVHIASKELYGGTILYLDTGWNMSEELVQVWLYDDTLLLGELNGKTMQQLVEERTVDIYVETELFPFRTDIMENTRLYPAMSVSVSEDLQQ